MDLNWNKYDIEVQYDDAIKREQILFDVMQQTFSCPDGLYMDEKYLLIDRIKKDQLRKNSAAEVEILNRDKKERNQKKEVTSKNSPRKCCFVNMLLPLTLIDLYH